VSQRDADFHGIVSPHARTCRWASRFTLAATKPVCADADMGRLR
jgi:hypothetical protein